MEEQVSKNGNVWQKYTGLIVHDLRRSAIRNMVAAGNPQNWCMAISGHKTASVFRRYAIVDTADLTTAMQRIEAAALKEPQKISVNLGQMKSSRTRKVLQGVESKKTGA